MKIISFIWHRPNTTDWRNTSFQHHTWFSIHHNTSLNTALQKAMPNIGIKLSTFEKVALFPRPTGHHACQHKQWLRVYTKSFDLTLSIFFFLHQLSHWQCCHQSQWPNKLVSVNASASHTDKSKGFRLLSVPMHTSCNFFSPLISRKLISVLLFSLVQKYINIFALLLLFCFYSANKSCHACHTVLLLDFLGSLHTRNWGRNQLYFI